MTRAAKESGYRLHLLNDTQTAIQEELAKQGLDSGSIPSNCKFRIIEAEENEVILVLPKPLGSGHELNIEDLDRVSAGQIIPT